MLVRVHAICRCACMCVCERARTSASMHARWTQVHRHRYPACLYETCTCTRTLSDNVPEAILGALPHVHRGLGNEVREWAALHRNLFLLSVPEIGHLHRRRSHGLRQIRLRAPLVSMHVAHTCKHTRTHAHTHTRTRTRTYSETAMRADRGSPPPQARWQGERRATPDS